jgi:hypothetical protein
MPLNNFRFLMTMAVLAAVGSGCVGAIQATTAHGTTPAAHVVATARPKPQPIDVLSASFASASTGYLLAEPRCATLANPCKTTVLMRRTVDGGRTWSAVPGPAAPPVNMFQASASANAVGRILFTSLPDGYAYGPGLWRTADGGATWRQVRVPGRVAQFAVAGRRMVAVIGGCGSARECTFRVYSALAGDDTWRLVTGPALTGTSASLAVSGTTGYLLTTSADPGGPRLLGGPVTASARWRALPVPCAGAWSAAIAAVPGSLFLGCGGEPGAGNQGKTAYLSGNGGRTWHKVASPPGGGYLGGATMTPGGTIFLSGGRMDVYISRDHGRGWHESPSLANAAGLASAGLTLAGAAVTDMFGVVIQEGVYTRQAWLTRDGGLHWTPSTIR